MSCRARHPMRLPKRYTAEPILRANRSADIPYADEDAEPGIYQDGGYVPGW
jgi:hypothetical protein